MSICRKYEEIGGKFEGNIKKYEGIMEYILSIHGPQNLKKSRGG